MVYNRIRRLQRFKNLIALDSNSLVYERNAIVGRWYDMVAAVYIARKAIGLLDKEIARRDLPAQPPVSYRLRPDDKKNVSEMLDAFASERWYHFWK